MKKIVRLSLIVGFVSLFMLLVAGAFAAGSPETTVTAPAAEAVASSENTVVGTLTGPAEGDALDIALTYLQANAAALGLEQADLADVVVTDRYVSEHTGVTHIYLRQRFAGIEVFGANFNVNVLPDGRILNIGNRFIPNLAQQIVGRVPALTPAEAVAAAAAHNGLPTPQGLTIEQAFNSSNQTITFSGANISYRPIPVKLWYQPAGKGQIELAWEASIEAVGSADYWQTRVSALDGRFLDQNNLTVHEDLAPYGLSDGRTIAIERAVETAVWHAPIAIAQYDATTALAGSYKVFAPPVESPTHANPPNPPNTEDNRVIVTDPDSAASPFGWHDTNGVAGAEYTITRGNNVWAYQDRDGNNASAGDEPDGGAPLVFNFPLDLTQDPSAYIPAAVTNLFFWNNIIHDVFYEYGFTEAAGNFQFNNYGNGGIGGDHVVAEAQDNALGGANCNANFSTPTDGGSGRMQMYLCTNATPTRDGDLDNGVIVHEYGHGISIRLTGGPSNSGCLSNSEQAGEGWSDWMALMMTIEPGDTGADSRGMGTYLFGQPTTGAGIRPAPYSTNFAVNGYTYSDVGTLAVPHGVGFVWATITWDMAWALIDQYGFDADLYNGTGGNNLAMQLVVDGLKLQPCGPGFVDSRDAILAADVALTGGANQCLLWEAFANRGLGYSAVQGSNSRGDEVEAFDLPPACLLTLKISKTATPDPVYSGNVLTYTLVAINDTVGALTNVVISDTVPMYTTYLAGTASDGGSESGGAITWPGITLASGESVTRTFQVQVDNGIGVETSWFDDMESGDSNWAVSHGAGAIDWALGTANPHSPDYAWFAEGIGSVTDQYLAFASPIVLPSFAELHVWHDYNLETGYDGGVIELSTDGGTVWQDLDTYMTQNGYNSTISGSFSSPIAGRRAFSGDSNGYIETVIDLSSFAGQSALIRFRLATDTSVADEGWYVDDVSISAATVTDQIENTACVVAAEGDNACTTIATSVLLSAVQQYALTLDVQGNGTTDPAPGVHSYEVGAVVTVTATADPGWTFSHWQGDHTGTDPVAVVTVNGNMALTAVFVDTSYIYLPMITKGD